MGKSIGRSTGARAGRARRSASTNAALRRTRGKVMTSNQPGVSEETLASISTPDHVESRLGPLEFVDGAPSDATAELLYEHLDFISGVKAFIDAYPGASLIAIRRGFRSIGVEDNSILLFSELMDSASLFLTGNTDTIYALGLRRPERRADGRGRALDPGAVGIPRHGRRHVVPLDHRHGPARARPWNRRAVPARRPGIRRAVARRRILRVAFAHRHG